ncbi:GAF domain-containing protein [Streptomyces sp. SL13]|uniref:GAF domain-containing protein n=1 Tax=Streptantibioticus silvisoli TaxID=2705255 RepID=A0AA90H4B5_9ACTN|nr:helix-turn-helix domain-containing protein [Streptantibioticus silvisoli]MDI5971721.1 GAF domain-containing protein [Streptantibioticus silvisoli]
MDHAGPSAKQNGQLRPLIGESWHRVLRVGIDPDRGGPPDGLLSAEELEHRRTTSRIGEVLGTLREGLSALAGTETTMLVVCDAEGRVLWRDGGRGMRRQAERVALFEGSSWSEATAGTNAIGTSLVARRPLRVDAGEHFVRALREMSCAAAPLHDPRDGSLLGVVNVASPAALRQPATLALVSAVAQVAEGELRLRHWEAVDRLRSVAAPLLARIGGRAVAVDRDGWTAAVTGMPPAGRIALPADPVAGRTWLPSLGRCVLEPLPGGWLIRFPDADEAPGGAGQVVVDLTSARSWSVSVHGPSGSWTRPLSPRHAELLFALALRPEGSTAAQLAADLFGDTGRAVTVRAELSRLRRHLGAVLAHRPYRFAEATPVRLLRPADPRDLLPFSTAPAVLAARGLTPPSDDRRGGPGRAGPAHR